MILLLNLKNRSNCARNLKCRTLNSAPAAKAKARFQEGWLGFISKLLPFPTTEYSPLLECSFFYKT